MISSLFFIHKLHLDSKVVEVASRFLSKESLTLYLVSRLHGMLHSAFSLVGMARSQPLAEIFQIESLGGRS